MSSLPSAAAEATSIDWTVIAATLATFVATFIASWRGLKRGRRNLEEKTHIESAHQEIAIKGGVLMDNVTMIRLTEEMRNHTEALTIHTRATDQNTSAQLRVWETMMQLRMDIKEFKNKV